MTLLIFIFLLMLYYTESTEYLYISMEKKNYMMKTLNIQILWVNYITSEWNKDSEQFKF